MLLLLFRKHQEWDNQMTCSLVWCPLSLAECPHAMVEAPCCKWCVDSRSVLDGFLKFGGPGAMWTRVAMRVEYDETVCAAFFGCWSERGALRQSASFSESVIEAQH